MKKTTILFFSFMGLLFPVKIAAMKKKESLLEQCKTASNERTKQRKKMFLKYAAYFYIEYENFKPKHRWILEDKENSDLLKRRKYYPNKCCPNKECKTCIILKEPVHFTFSKNEKLSNIFADNLENDIPFPDEEIKQITFASRGCFENTKNTKAIENPLIKAIFYGPKYWSFMPDLTDKQTAFVFFIQGRWLREGNKAVPISEKTGLHEIFETLPEGLKNNLTNGQFLEILSKKD